MKILICGGRDYADELRFFQQLNGIIEALDFDDLIIMEGGAKGADALAAKYAKHFNYRHAQFPADWEKHGRAAGPLRNQEMLDAGPDLVVAFPGGRGTADMVRRAKAVNINVIEIPG